jgi:hypothetical protein
MAKLLNLKKLGALNLKPIRFRYNEKIYETEEPYFLIELMAKKEKLNIKEFLKKEIEKEIEKKIEKETEKELPLAKASGS